MTLRKFLKLAWKNDDLRGSIDLKDFPESLLGKNAMQLSLLQTDRVAEILDMDTVDVVVEIVKQRCRKCGCTESNCEHCIETTGDACSWVEPNLCSACVPKPKSKKMQKQGGSSHNG